MPHDVRPARPEDVPGISEWTKDTFSWGDYVPESLSQWLTDPGLHVQVAVDADDRPLAMAVVRMLSDDEGWLSAARVHPSAQRRGLGSLLNASSVDWIKAQGGRVARLAVEEDNAAARSQVEKLGYRRTSTWVYGVIEGGESPLQPVKGEQIKVTGRSDVDPAWMYWSTSEMFDSGRGLKASGWTWRRARVADLHSFASDQALFSSPAGWVAIELAEDDQLDVVWVATSPNDFPRLIAGVDSLARDMSRARVVYRLPQTGWSGEALRRVGAEVKETLVYAKAV